jgi:hypothetical protein
MAKRVEKKTINDLNRMFDYIDWPTYLQNSMYPSEVQSYLDATREIYVFNEALFGQINTLVKAQTPATMANYFFLRLIVQSVPFLVISCSRQQSSFRTRASLQLRTSLHKGLTATVMFQLEIRTV